MNDILLHILDSLRSIPGDIKSIIERKIQLFLLDLGDSISSSIAQAIPRLVGVIFFLMSLFFALLAFGFYLGEVVENTALGFVLVSSILLLIAVVGLAKTVNLKKSPIKQKIEQNFIELSDKVGQSTPKSETQNQLKE